MFVFVCIGFDPYNHYIPVLRPALIVSYTGSLGIDVINVQLFLDGSNDDRLIGQMGRSVAPHAVRGDGPVWLTSVSPGYEIGQYRLVLP